MTKFNDSNLTSFSLYHISIIHESIFQDFVFTVIIAVFWLSASAAWANGVIGLKSATDDSSWIHSSNLSTCQKINDKYVHPGIKECGREEDQTGSFGGANASVVSIYHLQS